MSSSTYTYTVVRDEDGDRNLTVFIPGRATPPIREDHPNWDDIFTHVVINNDPSVEALTALLDIAAAAALKFENLSERIAIKDGRVYCDHDEIDNRLTKQIIRFLKEDQKDYLPLVRFFEKAASNPNEHSRRMLGDWLAEHDFTITEDGDIVGYKGVRGDGKGGYTSTMQGPAIINGEQHEKGYVPNAVGDIIEVPRSYVQHNPREGCSTGLHIGTWEFAQRYRYSAGAVLQVHVNPRDVVSVPTECGAQKMRACRYKVVAFVNAKIEEAVITLADDEDYDDSGPLNDAILPSNVLPEVDEAEDIETEEVNDADVAGTGEDADNYDDEDDDDDDEQCECGLSIAECDDRDDCPDEGADTTLVFHPSDMEFANMIGRAKTRRQNFVKYATKMGPWTLVNEDAPLEATSWSVPQDS
jgi:hypothetical protein